LSGVNIDSWLLDLEFTPRPPELTMDKRLKLYTNKKELIDAILIVEDKIPVSVQLVSLEFTSGKITGEKLFYCMQTLHQLLHSHGLKLLCNCFRYDVYPSGMSLDMGHGIKAYKMEMGRSARQLVDIFDPTNDPDAIVTPEEQKAFRSEWVKSLMD